jgi:alpha-ribazole phosphatase
LERDAWLADWDAGCHPGHPWGAYQRLISSPALRCRILAAALAQRLGLPLDIDPAWQELDFGAWEGQSWDAIGRPAVDAWAADPLDFAPGAGESARSMAQRVVAAYETWRGQGQDTILVTHGGVIRLLQAWHAARPVYGAPLKPAALDSACLQALGQSSPPHGSLLLLASPPAP